MLETFNISKAPSFHVSDQTIFQRCRRKWQLSTRNQFNLTPKNNPERGALWFGTGFHFVCEDFHGYHRFPTMHDAYKAYRACFKPNQLPIDIMELDQLADGMITHYYHWLSQRSENLQTVWINGVPQVEVRWKLPTNLRTGDHQIVYYEGTFDRVVKDENGQYFIVDIKTAKSFDVNQLDTNAQATRYGWAGNQLYGIDFAGCIWQTHKKSVPYEPEELKRGGLSVNKNQDTTHFLYRRALTKMYGERWKSEQKYVDMLNHLLAVETDTSDKFIRRDKAIRNKAQYINGAKHGENILIDMLDPSLSCYPNPTRDCSWDCDFRDLCIQMDDGSDYQSVINNEFEVKPPDSINDEWRKNIVYP